MRKLLPALAATAALAVSMAPAVHADLASTVAATLSCNDGHSVALSVDQATLTDLVAEVDAINSSGTGQSCTLDTAAVDPTTGATTDWTVFDYNPSGQAISPRHSPASGPAATPDGGFTWNFNFRSGIFTALFTTTDSTVTGDLCPMTACRTLKDDITISGDALSFMTQHNGGANCSSNVPATVRFYFVSPSASGSSVGSPPAGFYTRFWWSNPMNMALDPATPSGTITAHLVPSEWSDWNGKSGTDVPEAFAEATHKVQAIGLSFGGLCFFETGVTPDPSTTNEQFSSKFTESSV